MDTYSFSQDFYTLLSNYPKANTLIKFLENHGEIFLFGGAIREYNDSRFENMPRDFDIVIKKYTENINLDEVLTNFSYKKNRFEGYKINVDSLEFDVWEIENTWAFREEKVKCRKDEYSKKLQDTVFLNIDSVVYNLTRKKLYDYEYEKAMKSRVLDVLLEENPYKELNMIRAILFKRKYNMSLSNKLIMLFHSFIHQNNDYLEKLYQEQLKHYKFYIIDKKSLEKELNEIKSSGFG